MSLLEISSENADTFAVDTPVDHRDFTFLLPKAIVGVVGLQLLDLIIPFSWNIIHNLNQTFQVTRGGQLESITIPHGSYTSYELATAITTVMNTGGNPVTCSYVSTPDVFRFTGNSFTLHGSTMKRSLRKVLGFDNKDHIGATINSPFSPQVTGGNALELQISPINIDVQATNMRANTILVPVNANPHGNIRLQAVGGDESGKLCLDGPTDIQTIRFRLRYMNSDEKLGGGLGLRGQPVYIKLRFLHQ